MQYNEIHPANHMELSPDNSTKIKSTVEVNINNAKTEIITSKLFITDLLQSENISMISYEYQGISFYQPLNCLFKGLSGLTIKVLLY